MTQVGCSSHFNYCQPHGAQTDGQGCFTACLFVSGPFPLTSPKANYLVEEDKASWERRTIVRQSVQGSESHVALLFSSLPTRYSTLDFFSAHFQFHDWPNLNPYVFTCSFSQCTLWLFPKHLCVSGKDNQPSVYTSNSQARSWIV